MQKRKVRETRQLFAFFSAHDVVGEKAHHYQVVKPVGDFIVENRPKRLEHVAIQLKAVQKAKSF